MQGITFYLLVSIIPSVGSPWVITLTSLWLNIEKEMEFLVFVCVCVCVFVGLSVCAYE